MYLGHLLGQEQIYINSKKIKSVYKWLRPRNLKQVQGFLGFTNFNK